MQTIIESPVNRVKLDQADNAWRRMLAEALRRGFHGAVSIEVSVQDGTIQCVRQRLERLER